MTKTQETSLTVGEQAKLVECEEVIEKGFSTFVEVGNALMRIRDEQLYTDVAKTFEEYCKRRITRKWIHRRNGN